MIRPPNLLLRNDGAWQLAEVGIEAGVAFSGYGKDQAGMGVLHNGDFDRDGRLDLFVTNFSNDVNTLYRNEGDLALYRRHVRRLGLGGIALPYLGWGTGFFDFDNDGWLDLFVAQWAPLSPVKQLCLRPALRPSATCLYQNREGRFARGRRIKWERDGPLKRSAGPPPLGDVDNDGDVDLLIVNLNDTPDPTLLRNDGGNRNNWLGLKLIGSESNRDAIGAQVRVRVDGLDPRARGASRLWLSSRARPAAADRLGGARADATRWKSVGQRADGKCWSRRPCVAT